MYLLCDACYMIQTPPGGKTWLLSVEGDSNIRHVCRYSRWDPFGDGNNECYDRWCLPLLWCRTLSCTHHCCINATASFRAPAWRPLYVSVVSAAIHSVHISLASALVGALQYLLFQRSNEVLHCTVRYPLGLAPCVVVVLFYIFQFRMALSLVHALRMHAIPAFLFAYCCVHNTTYFEVLRSIFSSRVI